jgi:hypothetical protein
MPRYIIERDIPGAGNMSRDDLQGASAKSCSTISCMAPGLTWLHSYVTDDRIYCVYDAPSKDAIREHAEKSGFPANRISDVKSMIHPTWGE